MRVNVYGYEEKGRIEKLPVTARDKARRAVDGRPRNRDGGGGSGVRVAPQVFCSHLLICSHLLDFFLYCKGRYQ